MISLTMVDGNLLIINLNEIVMIKSFGTKSLIFTNKEPDPLIVLEGIEIINDYIKKFGLAL